MLTSMMNLAGLKPGLAIERDRTTAGYSFFLYSYPNSMPKILLLAQSIQSGVDWFYLSR